MARVCGRCKDKAMQPGDDGLCIPCRIITQREEISRLHKLLRELWLCPVPTLRVADLVQEDAPKLAHRINKELRTCTT